MNKFKYSNQGGVAEGRMGKKVLIQSDHVLWRSGEEGKNDFSLSTSHLMRLRETPEIIR